MDAKRIKEIQNLITNHQASMPKTSREISRSVCSQCPSPVPTGAGRLTDDLSKVASSDVIGKGGTSDLRK